ncbi:unnamed protein product [Paramecium octaurelia]|uniref:Uncharacterized protein n=1 Tax=Paramecium octaurelia TaxID=43137 RepID=A0A8S1YH76_PAROT|nr:unnamed protein product [Paramecium octaurelia]
MNNFCQVHGNQSITHICTFNHECQKRMCPDCQYAHQQIVPGSKIIPITKFIEMMDFTISQYDSEVEDNIEMQMKKNFKTTLDYIQNLSQKAQENFTFIFGEIRERDNSYLNLFRKHPLEISLKDLNKITNIWHNQIFEKWKKQKETLLKIVQRKVNLIYDSIGKFTWTLENQIKQWTEEKSTNINHDSPFSYESIQHPVYFGIRHGQAFSKILGVFEECGYTKLHENMNIIHSKGFVLNQQKLKLTEFQIKILQDDGYLQYLRDGVVLKTERISNINQCLQNNKNLEQVKHLRWEGQYGQELQKVGLWSAFWQGKKLDIGGRYDKNGLKEDQWIELSNIYQSQCQVTETGNYQQGRKTGFWQTIYKGQRIGGGWYDQRLENKVGFWKEIHLNFNNQCQIFYEGEYINGMKSGQWGMYFKDDTSFDYKRIGGGVYDNQNYLKQGQWDELYNQYQDSLEFIQTGVYQRGMREGRWDIYHNMDILSSQQKQIRGGGEYAQSWKTGKWIEPITNQITCEGSYQEGQRVGQWAIKLMDQNIGGGFYDQNGLKINIWTEIHEKYNKCNRISYIGEYLSGKKINVWKIQNNSDQIGGGLYEDGLKSGKWVEIHESFQDNFQIIIEGEYDKGKKSGIWTSKIRQPSSTQFRTMQVKMMDCGGGNYNDGLKTGEWIDLDQNYEKINQISYHGQYQEGKKVQIWDIKTNNNDKIGGGAYLITGEKHGEWIELDDNFRNLCQLINKGAYQNGKKVGKWTIQLMESKEQIEDIGGGEYDDQGRQIKSWTELYQNFWKDCRVIFEGKYQDGKKQGEWQSLFYQNSNQDYVKFGGGSYNRGLKDGPWIEFQEQILKPQEYTKVSKYKNGLEINQKSK